jgi:hypothetical protein
MIRPALRLVFGMLWLLARIVWPWVAVAVIGTWLVMQ